MQDLFYRARDAFLTAIGARPEQPATPFGGRQSFARAAGEAAPHPGLGRSLDILNDLTAPYLPGHCWSIYGDQKTLDGSSLRLVGKNGAYQADNEIPYRVYQLLATAFDRAGIMALGQNAREPGAYETDMQISSGSVPRGAITRPRIDSIDPDFLTRHKPGLKAALAAQMAGAILATPENTSPSNTVLHSGIGIHPGVTSSLEILNALTREVFPGHHWRAYGNPSDLSRTNLRLVSKTGDYRSSEIPVEHYNALCRAFDKGGFPSSLATPAEAEGKTAMRMDTESVRSGHTALPRIDFIDPDYLAQCKDRIGSAILKEPDLNGARLLAKAREAGLQKRAQAGNTP